MNNTLHINGMFMLYYSALQRWNRKYMHHEMKGGANQLCMCKARPYSAPLNQDEATALINDESEIHYCQTEGKHFKRIYVAVDNFSSFYVRNFNCSCSFWRCSWFQAFLFLLFLFPDDAAWTDSEIEYIEFEKRRFFPCLNNIRPFGSFPTTPNKNLPHLF